MNPRGGRGGGGRVRADVDARGRVAARRPDDDARVLGDDAAVLADDVAVAHLHRAHHPLLEIEVQRAAHRQLVLNHLQLACRIAPLYIYYMKHRSLPSLHIR